MGENKILIRTVIEILGSPKEHVEETMKLVINRAKENFKLLSEKTYKSEEVQGMWSTFAELEISFKDMEQLIIFCFEFMPSSIEVIEPVSFNLKCTDISNTLNDLLAKLHRYDMVVKNLTAENVILKRKQNQ
ncbi:hypothetical protein J4409_00400 [Candidatus Woesearchaeota archaeon]|nr:hypothetical protein [Candidatus Woesearchaeota archaeon]